ncbi:histidine phosphatase family protein [Nocardioides panacisoli]|uniref:histidine phosphatase family protein n=1 Tax=Nocardioides panacisoli TaxID=627624 RepID=UPI001C63B158|nr:histidine phosphatase family protein [Nocardioides panacisoli]QYJ03195.1 histidine phosphatase family protein [Nocardioides panacisoli]
MGLVLLVRHGQASFGADDYDVLSDVGWQQGRLLGAWLAAQGVTPARVVRGDMRRHRETAEAMAEGAGWGGVPTEVAADWDEFDHLSVVAADPDHPGGELSRREFQQVFERATARWTAGEGEGYAETYAGFCARVRRGLESAAGASGTTVVVSSGGPIAVAAADLADPAAEPPVHARLWQRFNTVVVNSSVTRVIVGATGTRLLTFNEHAHLTPDVLTYR